MTSHGGEALLDELSGLEQRRPLLEDQHDRRETQDRLGAHRLQPRRAVEGVLEGHGDQALDLGGREARAPRSAPPRAEARTPGRRPRRRRGSSGRPPPREWRPGPPRGRAGAARSGRARTSFAVAELGAEQLRGALRHDPRARTAVLRRGRPGRPRRVAPAPGAARRRGGLSPRTPMPRRRCRRAPRTTGRRGPPRARGGAAPPRRARPAAGPRRGWARRRRGPSWRPWGRRSGDREPAVLAVRGLPGRPRAPGRRPPASCRRWPGRPRRPGRVPRGRLAGRCRRAESPPPPTGPARHAGCPSPRRPGWRAPARRPHRRRRWARGPGTRSRRRRAPRGRPRPLSRWSLRPPAAAPRAAPASAPSRAAPAPCPGPPRRAGGEDARRPGPGRPVRPVRERLRSPAGGRSPPVARPRSRRGRAAPRSRLRRPAPVAPRAPRRGRSRWPGGTRPRGSA